MKQVALVIHDPKKVVFKLDPNDDLIISLLENQEVYAKQEIWSNPNVNWNQYDLIIVRSTWDYPENLQEFKKWLGKLKSDKLNVVNPVDVMLWNMDKRYLLDLQESGIPIPETVMVSEGEEFNIFQIMKSASWDKCIIKPRVGCGSTDVVVINGLQDAIQRQEESKGLFTGINFIVQEYIEEIVTAGEWSLCYFGGKFSHAIMAKTNSENILYRGQPFKHESRHPPSNILKAGAKIMKYLAEKEPLYCRVDLVERAYHDVQIIELELIEPNLFLSSNPEAHGIFAQEILNKLEKV